MVWDLRGALLKKEERESARLMDFAFRLRARSFALLAERLGEEPEALARATIRQDDEGLLADLAERHPDEAVDLPALFKACHNEARRSLIAELGDPAPYRLL
ncbi:hypothetical protein [Sphingomonas arenae]|uniref:hypothetical protein n=1 Tax=Sphingomonas arenae TaxID=2812555 RepID=UPI00196796BA|nr:hypothetical protein [Sphingomonas arenae]